MICAKSTSVPALHLCIIAYLIVSFQVAAHTCCLALVSYHFQHHFLNTLTFLLIILYFFTIPLPLLPPPPPSRTRIHKTPTKASKQGCSSVFQAPSRKVSGPSNQPTNLALQHHGRKSIYKTRKQKSPILRQSPRITKNKEGTAT